VKEIHGTKKGIPVNLQQKEEEENKKSRKRLKR